ncbi:stage II sporulation protein D [Paenibacillus sp. D2_2]|uniref:stage II sporulation protein D n=1 Tax=Paenibacillus sp. D2_2 TaxID=3073092 RepID=UPI0028156B43|nr:stage II sporulation protein D [Paenibacillus sp. D2_2]WMT43621.1 stage II sporulation protein D [Paenibacillus sp. D2_2]
MEVIDLMNDGRSIRFGGLAALAAVSALAVLLPALLVQRGATQAQDAAGITAAVHSPAAGQAGGKAVGSGREAAADPDQWPVRVYLTHTGKVETLPLEEYVTGVLAAEMPADFELAALKAQAIAARTFIVRRLAASDTSGVPSGNADVNDTVEHQAYVSSDSLRAWENDGRGEDLQKLQQAASLTRGIIMTYQGQPITAAFFSSSGGYTENSEDYWSDQVPYLRSVSSPWDSKLDPHNQETAQISVNELFSKLGQSAPALPTTGRQGAPIPKLFQVLSVTTGGSVKDIRIGDKTYSGREVREKLELRSSQFNMVLDGAEVKITTYGSGHGVGMSQWGANGMAKQGYTTTQILKHYYTGISFNQVSDVLAPRN